MYGHRSRGFTKRDDLRSVASSAAVIVDTLNENPISVALARQMPSFAGLYFSDQGDLVIALTDINDGARAEQLVRPLLGNHRTARGIVTGNTAQFVARTAQYSFIELAGYRMQLRNHIFGVPGVISLDVKESENRVKIGVADQGAISVVTALLPTLGIPTAAVTFWSLPEPRNTTHTLDSAMGPIHGGWRINNTAGGTCSLGFAARTYSNWSPVFVTASHCTIAVHDFDNSPIYQNGTQIGLEIADPAAININGALYRHSDAALFSASVGLQWGTIARTTSSCGDDGCSAPITILHSNPTLQITGTKNYVIENETLHKIGRETGWTYGAVEDSCTDFYSSGWTKWCSDRVDFEVEDGDSGSPVFSLKGDGTIELRGIVFGQISWPYSDGMMSNLGQIQTDLGQLVLFDPGPPSVTIAGPTQVPSGAICYWGTTIQNGLSPFTHQWSGLFSGTTPTIGGEVNSAGWLEVLVTDRLGRQNFTAINVTLLPPGQFNC